MRKFFVLNIVIFSFMAISAQENPVLTKETLENGNPGISNVWRQVKISDDFYSKKSRGGYMFAIEGYLIGYEYNPNYPELNYKLGISYLRSVYKANSLIYLKKAYEQKNNVTKDILWQLALAYQYNYQFDSALYYIDLYKKTLTSADYSKQSKDIENVIKECKIAIDLVNHPVSVEIENFKEINTEYPEYCPVVNADESMIYFTARRPDCVGATLDQYDGQYYEDIFVSQNIDGKWTKPENVGMPMNGRHHDATVALSPDGNSMLIYRSGDIYLCQKKGDKWSYPEYLEAINSDETENSACFSFDGKTIYFVRGKTNDIKTSNGDIYFTKFVNGSWTKAEKLPDIINTKYDEDGVFLHPDGRTLYFSSMGHNSMGGFDIFKSTKDLDGNWTTPVNLGYPINTPDDDVYFVMSADGKTAYYSSIRNDGDGFSDIYKVKFVKDKQIYQDTDDNLIASVDSSVTQLIDNGDETVYLTLVTGMIYDAISLKPVSSTVQIYNNSSDELVFETQTDDFAGKYIVTLPSGTNYGMNIRADGYLFHSENFDLPADKPFNRVYMDVGLFEVTQGAKVVLRNIFFDFNESTLRKESVPELERVVTFLMANPTVKIEVSGHTDNKGSYDYNKKLSEARAKSVVDYFISKGISKDRLTYRGASYDEPVDTNDTDEGRQKNRRVEFKITGN